MDAINNNQQPVVRLLTSQGVTLPAAMANERLCNAARCGNLPVIRLLRVCETPLDPL
jgi:hypothetical protein